MEEPLSIRKTTYSVVDFLEWQRQGSLDLRPFYQRRSVWNPKVKSLLIDSILRGYPLPLVFLHNRLDISTSKSIRQVVDGQQRLRTILAFVDIDALGEVEDWDRFTVLRTHNPDFAGLAFKQLPDAIQEHILQTSLSVNVLPTDIDDVTVLSIFQRMNSTGYKLNDQEIRNATYFGEFKDSSYRLAYSQNQRWQRWMIFTRQEVAQMKEVELTADLMGFLLRGVAARGKATLDGLYRSYDENFERRDEIESRFLDTFDFLEGVYSEVASRSGLKRFRSTAWFYAVFAVASAGQGTLTPEELVLKLERAEVALRSDELDDNLAKFLRGATADKVSRQTRISFVAAA
ncbi:DUF262 domain-containing protein [Dietzia maris]|uniref:DUF262 domain-containing protein n=1 Tax=Dietzia maris TaxID=37915 RepID=A0AAE4QZ79_9ACTN|nr:DUF262 domain-containing protein [Dietzia maris]MDV6298131.1 DUF262 domain-containing protein [Dietzia maris]